MSEKQEQRLHAARRKLARQRLQKHRAKQQQERTMRRLPQPQLQTDTHR